MSFDPNASLVFGLNLVILLVVLSLAVGFVLGALIL